MIVLITVNFPSKSKMDSCSDDARQLRARLIIKENRPFVRRRDTAESRVLHLSRGKIRGIHIRLVVSEYRRDIAESVF